MIKREFDYGKLSFELIIITFFCLWIVFHLHIHNINLETHPEITNVTIYTCPGVGEQTNINGYLGCKLVRVDQRVNTIVIKSAWGILWY